MRNKNLETGLNIGTVVGMISGITAVYIGVAINGLSITDSTVIAMSMPVLYVILTYFNVPR